jgi:hypothetical protein
MVELSLSLLLLLLKFFLKVIFAPMGGIIAQGYGDGGGKLQ